MDKQVLSKGGFVREYERSRLEQHVTSMLSSAQGRLWRMPEGLPEMLLEQIEEGLSDLWTPQPISSYQISHVIEEIFLRFGLQHLLMKQEVQAFVAGFANQLGCCDETGGMVAGEASLSALTLPPLRRYQRWQKSFFESASWPYKTMHSLLAFQSFFLESVLAGHVDKEIFFALASWRTGFYHHYSNIYIKRLFKSIFKYSSSSKFLVYKYSQILQYRLEREGNFASRIYARGMDQEIGWMVEDYLEAEAYEQLVQEVHASSMAQLQCELGVAFGRFYSEIKMLGAKGVGEMLRLILEPRQASEDWIMLESWLKVQQGDGYNPDLIQLFSLNEAACLQLGSGQAMGLYEHFCSRWQAGSGVAVVLGESLSEQDLFDYLPGENHESFHHLLTISLGSLALGCISWHQYSRRLEGELDLILNRFAAACGQVKEGQADLTRYYVGFYGLSQALILLTGSYSGGSQRASELGIKILRQLISKIEKARIGSTRQRVHLVGSMDPRVARLSYQQDVQSHPELADICENQSYTLGFWLPLWHSLSLEQSLQALEPYVQHLAVGNSVRLHLCTLPSACQLAQLLKLVKSYNMGYLYLIIPPKSQAAIA